MLRGMLIEIVPNVDNCSKLVMFTLFNDYVWELNENSFFGKFTLIVNEGGIQNSRLPPGIKELLKEHLKGYWQDIYDLLPELPKTTKGNFTGKVELHRFEGHLKKIHFLPKL